MLYNLRSTVKCRSTIHDWSLFIWGGGQKSWCNTHPSASSASRGEEAGGRTIRLVFLFRLLPLFSFASSSFIVVLFYSLFCLLTACSGRFFQPPLQTMRVRYVCGSLCVRRNPESQHKWSFGAKCNMSTNYVSKSLNL